ncbi:unnamed protein product [Thelazia callipaeda]|uniref:Orphan protein n=1 Tax=Thelazia callipaeda TaxID=103827 RepID=A0A0N5D9T3_THECL|nr:unnamed protein product [Thelazia callipaeda]
MNTSTYSCETPATFSTDWFNSKHIGQQPEQLSVVGHNVIDLFFIAGSGGVLAELCNTFALLYSQQY